MCSLADIVSFDTAYKCITFQNSDNFSPHLNLWLIRVLFYAWRNLWLIQDPSIVLCMKKSSVSPWNVFRVEKIKERKTNFRQYWIITKNRLSPGRVASKPHIKRVNMIDEIIAKKLLIWHFSRAQWKWMSLKRPHRRSISQSTKQRDHFERKLKHFENSSLLSCEIIQKKTTIHIFLLADA